MSPKQTIVQYYNNMDEIDRANKRVKTTGSSCIAQYHNFVNQLDEEECKIKMRYEALDEKKSAIAGKHGNPNASENDLIEINAGGKIIAAKRGTLCQIKGSRLEVLFSGRWDKELQKDDSGKIFLVVNPEGFQAIIDYLNEMAISTSDDPPQYPIADREENQHIIDHQLDLLMVNGQGGIGSKITPKFAHAYLLHDWLREDGSDGNFHLLYRSSRDGVSAEKFHSKCDNKGCTLSVIETTDGLIVGGYSNKSWKSTNGHFVAANKAFLFALSGNGITSPCKMKLKNPNDDYAVYHNAHLGPVFGCDNDMTVFESQLCI